MFAYGEGMLDEFEYVRAPHTGGGSDKLDAQRVAASYLLDALVNNEHFDEMWQRANGSGKTAKKKSRRKKKNMNESEENDGTL